MTKKPRSNLAKQVSAKSKKPSTYAAAGVLMTGIGGLLSAIFPVHALAITGVAAALGTVVGAVGTFKGVPTDQEAP